LLSLLSLKGTIVTVDALNCQRAIAQQIIDQGGDYAFALKGNQGTMYGDVRVFLDDPLTMPTTRHSTTDADHGRIETRAVAISTDIDWLQERHQWPGLTAIGKITRLRETGDKTSTETAYYLFSAQITAERGGSVVRDHWGVENRLHWCLDVTMNEDAARNRMDNGPQNLAVLRHMALNVMRKEETKMSLRGKLKKAAWNNSYLVKLLALFEMQLPCHDPTPFQFLNRPVKRGTRDRAIRSSPGPARRRFCARLWGRAACANRSREEPPCDLRAGQSHMHVPAFRPCPCRHRRSNHALTAIDEKLRFP
jgi:predicted transposase YbfD/YdcC